MCTGSLAAGGPEFRLGLLLFLFGRPNLLARVGELARDALHLGGDAVERVAQADVLAQLLEAPALAQLLHRVLYVVAERIGLLAHERLDLLVGNLEIELLRRSLEHELARDRPRCLLAETRDEVLGRLARHREICPERD